MDTSFMSIEYILPLADAGATLEKTGGKGASLARLYQDGFPVPDGFHVTTAAYQRFIAENQLLTEILVELETVDATQPATLEAASSHIRSLFDKAQTPPDVASAIAMAYAHMFGVDPVVAVRSSATAEDLPEASFAGQQETFLNVRGVSEVLKAVKLCWASLWTARAIGYRARHEISPEGLSLAVVVQLLIPAEAAGILFTANPVSGNRDQAMISAAWGLGEAVVGGLVTPDSLTVDKASGTIVERQTADKQLMTVRINGGTDEQPVPDELRHAPVLDDEHAGELVRLGVQIEELFGMPMDIEWALADGKFAILQARPITAIPKAEEFETDVWILPKPKAQYMRGSLVDLMSSPVSPLFVSMGIPSIINMGLSYVMSELTRSKPNLPRDYITTINHYAYMCGSFNSRELWWILTRMLPSFGRLMREGFLLWREDVHPRYAQVAAFWNDRSMEDLSTNELWDCISELVDQAGEYIASILIATTGASAGTEMLFSAVYKKMIMGEGDPEATAYLMGYNSIPIQAEKSLFDLANWVSRHPELKELFLNSTASDFANLWTQESPPQDVDKEIWADWQHRFRTHLDLFGYIIYEADFAKPLPLDDPTPMFQVCQMYLRGEGGNPYERQEKLETRRLKSMETVLQRTRGLRRWAFEKSLNLAQSRAEVREDAIADIGLGYPALRRALGELGHRMVQADVIETAEDIYYLNKSEIEAMVPSLGGGPLASMVHVVRERREELEAAKQLIPPPTLPPTKKYMGIDMGHFVPSAGDEHTEQVLKGVGASAGSVTANACVLSSPEDFDNMQPGYVIVAPITTPAWTPLFAMASAVVTDIGGPLSHGSIVAREYGIPAVLGTGTATRRILNGQLITVDGSAGKVILLEG